MQNRQIAGLFVLIAMGAVLLRPAAVMAQGVDLTGRPIHSIEVEGNREVSRDLLMNQITLRVGDPYDADQVARDIRNLTRLGRFSPVRASVTQNEDGTVNLTYIVTEQQLLTDVQVVGNKAYGDQELLGLILLRGGDPRGTDLIDQARQRIRKHYRDGGYYLADVSVDEQTLNDTGILILRIREGPRVRVREMRFEGNEAYSDEQLQSQIGTNTHVFIFRKGVLSEEQLATDVAELRTFYQRRGYLDVRVDRGVTLADNMEDAAVTFVIDEGRRYTVSDITLEGNTAFPDAQVLQAMTLKVGDIYSFDLLRDTEAALTDLYAKQGMLETRVEVLRVFDQSEPTVALIVRINESRRYTVGNIIIRGNALTQDKVIRRQLRGLQPGRAFDGTGIELSRRRIRSTAIIRDAQINVLGGPEEEVRDVLVEVEEASTGRLSFGAAVSSDSGLFGAISLEQRNFDFADTPESFEEFITGRAFRGAGQYFSITLQPGSEFQRYQVTFREPYILDSDYFLDTNAFYFTRFREKWDEERVGGTIGIGKRFGDVWSAATRVRVEGVDISDLDRDAPVDAFAVKGKNTVTGLGFSVARSTIDNRFFPTRGTRLQLGVERVGALGGDFDFTRLTGEYNAFFTLEEDFFGRKTVLGLRVESGLIVEDNEAPLFERFYAGGHRTFRGFDFRGVGPRGIQNNNGKLGDDPVGGDFMFLLGLEYNFPIWEELIRGVFFIDTGTVDEDVSLSDYRVSVGTGIRLSLPIFGQAPFAFDVAVPVVREDDDEERLFSFDLALPF